MVVREYAFVREMCQQSCVCGTVRFTKAQWNTLPFERRASTALNAWHNPYTIQSLVSPCVWLCMFHSDSCMAHFCYLHRWGSTSWILWTDDVRDIGDYQQDCKRLPNCSVGFIFGEALGINRSCDWCAKQYVQYLYGFTWEGSLSDLNSFMSEDGPGIQTIIDAVHWTERPVHM